MWHLLNPFNIAKISIHAPRTGSDTPSPPTPSPARANFNPRSPHGERRPRAGRSCSALPFQSTLPARGATRPQPADAHGSRFQSTLPARGATFHYRLSVGRIYHFNPRSPHGERRSGKSAHLPCCGISIHAPRTGSDVCAGTASSSPGSFQSTLPARGATRAKL